MLSGGVGCGLRGQQGPATRAGEGPLRGPDTSWPRRDAATRHKYQVPVKRSFLKPRGSRPAGRVSLGMEQVPQPQRRNLARLAGRRRLIGHRAGRVGRVTHGALAAPAPWCGALGSPCTCTEVHPGRLAPYCTVHLGASGLLCTCTKVHPGRLAPYCTVHLGASGLLCTCTKAQQPYSRCRNLSTI